MVPYSLLDSNNARADIFTLGDVGVDPGVPADLVHPSVHDTGFFRFATSSLTYQSILSLKATQLAIEVYVAALF